MTKFISKYKHYRLVMIPSRKDFVGGMPHIVYGHSITFKNGEYETDKKDELDFLRNHTDFGKVMFESESKTVEEEIKEIISEPEIKIEVKKVVRSKAKAKSRAKPKIKTKVG